MTISVLEQPTSTTATVTFSTLPAGNVILVWGQGANASGAAMTLPTSIDTVLTQINPSTVVGLNNQIAVVGVDVVPASAPTSYAISGTGGAFMTGGFEISGLATDPIRLHDPSLHQVGTLDTATAGSHTTQLVCPGTWTETEGFLFGYLQANASLGAVTVNGASSAFSNTSRFAFFRVLGANDKGTHPTVTLTWANDVRWISQMFLLRPPAVAPPTAPLSPNLVFARAVTDIIKTDAEDMEGSTYAIEPMIDAYELETGAGNTTALRRRYYEMRRALAELRAMPARVQTEIDILQGTLLPPAQYKAVYDTTSPFAGAVTDFVDGTAISATRWVGIRTIAGAVVDGGIRVSWWLDRAFSQSPSQSDNETSGPDWSLPLLLTSLTNGAHTLGVQITILDTDDVEIGVERHSYTFTSSGAPANTAPVVNAGVDQSVATGAIVTLTMSATDAEDVLSTTQAQWSQVSGPATLQPPPPAGSPVWSNIAFVTTGTYVLQASWADPRGAVGTDSKTVTVGAGGGAGNTAKARLGVFARVPDIHSSGRPQILKNDPATWPLFVTAYWEADGLKASVIRELISPQTWQLWRQNVNGYPPAYASLCGTTPSRVMLFACPMFTGDEFTSGFESMRQAYARGAQGAYITSDKWTLLRDSLGENGYGVDFPVYIDPCSEYDMGTFTSTSQQAGRMNFGRMRDGAACVRRFYEYLKAALPLLEMGSCRISSGGTSKYMTIGNNVETWGGQFPQGQNLAEALLYELNLQKAPLSSWWGWLAQNQYFNSESQFLTKWADTKAACQHWGIQTGSEEWGVAAQTVIADNLALQQFLDRQRDLFNALPASGPGSLKFHIYFEGLNPNSLYQHYPSGLTHFKLSSVFGA